MTDNDPQTDNKPQYQQQQQQQQQHHHQQKQQQQQQQQHSKKPDTLQFPRSVCSSAYLRDRMILSLLEPLRALS